MKGVLHIHSKHSYDGKQTLEEIREQFVAVGLRFACMTEHADFMDAESAEVFVDHCRQLSDHNFLFIPGFEVDYNRCHILMIGAKEFVVNKAKNPDELKEWTNKSRLVILAHPHRNQFMIDKFTQDLIHGSEIWNSQYDGKYAPRTRAIQFYKDLKKQKPNLIPSVGLDFHNSSHLGGPTITLDVDALDEAQIITAIRLGKYLVNERTDYLDTRLGLVSFVSICIVLLGKWVNKLLKESGLHLPRGLVKIIRKRI